MDQVAIDKKIKRAESIVNTYGALLNNLKHVNTALPVSLLPYKKEIIKQAIQTLLWELDDLDGITRNSLVQAYVYLEQFLPDEKVEIESACRVDRENGGVAVDPDPAEPPGIVALSVGPGTPSLSQFEVAST